jgi:hypothetical protein
MCRVTAEQITRAMKHSQLESSRWQPIIDFWRKSVKLTVIIVCGSGVAAVSAMVFYRRSTGQSSLVHKMSSQSCRKTKEVFRNMAMPLYIANKNTESLEYLEKSFNFGKPWIPYHL